MIIDKFYFSFFSKLQKQGKLEGKNDKKVNKDWRTVNVEPKGDTMGIC